MLIGLTVLLMVFLVLAWFAPRGEDKLRGKQENVYQGNLSADKEGTYLWLEKEETSLELSRDSGQIKCTVYIPEDGLYYINAGYMPLETSSSKSRYTQTMF